MNEKNGKCFYIELNQIEFTQLKESRCLNKTFSKENILRRSWHANFKNRFNRIDRQGFLI